MNTRQNGQSTETTSPAELAWDSPGVASVPYKFFFDQEIYEFGAATGVSRSSLELRRYRKRNT